MRERGLKSDVKVAELSGADGRSREGAWIEIGIKASASISTMSLP